MKKKNLTNIAYALIAVGGIFGVLYLSGFVYLNFYFSHLGTLVSFSNLPDTEIAVLGILPLILFIIILSVLWWSINQVIEIIKQEKLKQVLSHRYFLGSVGCLLFFSVYYYFVCSDGLICTDYFPIRIASLLTFGLLPIVGQGSFLIILFAIPLLCFFVSLSLLASYKQKMFKMWRYCIVAVTLIILYFYVVNIYSSLIFRANFTYDFILNPNSKIPIVQIIYSSPLVDSRKVIGKEQEIDYSYNQITVEEIKEGDIYFKKPDEWFEDVSGEKNFIGNFVLYFESGEQYYVKPLADLANAYAEILIKVSEAEKKDGAIIRDITLPINMEVRLFDAFVLPKREVKSLKYLALDVDDIQKGARYDYKNFFDQ